MGWVGGWFRLHTPYPTLCPTWGTRGWEAGEGRSELPSATCSSWDYLVTVLNLLPHSSSFPKS